MNTTLVLCLLCIGIAGLAVMVGGLAGRWVDATIARIVELAVALMLYTLAAGVLR
jgi:hypothetical protein